MKLKALPILSSLSLAVLLLTGCGKREYKPVAISELGKMQHKDEYIEVTGTVKLLTSFFTYSASFEEFWLGEDHKGGNVSIRNGTENNRMKKLPEDYESSDLEITDMNGKKIHVLDRAKVRGQVREYENGNWTINLDEIEKVE